MQREGGGAVVRRAHLMAVWGAFLVGCVVLVVVGCAGVRSVAPEEEQGHTEATEEQGRSPGAASEEDRCGRTRTIDLLGSASASVVDSSIRPRDPEARFTTNDVPGCPDKGGLLSGTDEPDRLAGREGEDEVRGLGGSDLLSGGLGSDVLYGGAGNDELQAGGYPP
jgi:RTX calcium-binding nonapeptide repeat (4 copies)